jgi:hypothetical protein
MIRQATPQFMAERMAATEIPDRFDHAEVAVAEGHASSGNKLSFLSPDFLREGSAPIIYKAVVREAFMQRIAERESVPPLPGQEMLNREVLKAHIAIEVPIPNP